MKHLSFFYFLITFPFGLVSLTITAILYGKTRERLLKYYLYFFTIFTLVVISNMFLFYIRANIPQIPSLILDSLDYFESFLAKALMMFIVPVFTHVLIEMPRAKIRNTIIGCISGGVYIIRHLLEMPSDGARLETIHEYFEDTTFAGLVLYSFFIGLKYYKTIQDVERKRLARTFLILTGIFLPGIIYDIHWGRVSLIRFFPVLYCCYSVAFTCYFIKNYWHQQQEFAQSPPDKAIEDALFEQYNISPREQEIVLLILQGYSNQKIGETLYISLNTVKTHVRNIYPKFGVKTRYELIALFKNSSMTNQTLSNTPDRS